MAEDEGFNIEEIRVLPQEGNPNFDIKRCSDSCSSSSSAAFPSNDSKWGADQMVKIELDAALALAELAQLAQIESENYIGESGRKRGNQRRMSTKRVKSESPARDEGKNLESSKLKSLDLVKQDRPVDHQQQHKKLLKIVPIKTVKDEPNSELLGPTHMYSTSYVSFGGGKSKQTLTEAEKEAKRLRRILANRESARQTIRRRQAICEELTRKAADLALENESMRREKELVMKEYQSLNDTNKHLKAQMAKTMKAKMEEAPQEIPSTHIKYPQESSSEKSQLLIHDRVAFPPFIWPSIIKSLNPVQAQPIPQKTIKHDPTIPNSKSSTSDDPENSMVTNGPRTPFYILPSPLFFPCPDHGNRLHPHPLNSHGLSDKQADIFVGNKHDTGSSSGNLENHRPSLLREVETCTNSTEANLTKYPPEASIRFLTNRNGECRFVGTHPNEVIHTPTPIRSVKPTISVKCDNEIEQDSTSKEDSVSSTSRQAAKSVLENINGPSECRSKKLVDAAEARKRRKEINKLKKVYNPRC